MTPWTRARGRPFAQRLIGFGEKVLYKLPLKGRLHDEMGNVAARFGCGIFLGYNRDANTYMVGTPNGIAMSRAIQRRPMEDRWDASAITALQATPWQHTLRPDRAVVLRPAADGEALDKFPPRQAALPRRFRLDKKDFDEHGYTYGCTQCEHIIRYGASRPG